MPLTDEAEQDNSPEKNERLGAFPFVIGGLSFIPLIGVLFGIIAIIWGIFTKKLGGKKLIIVGSLGITFTFVAYGSLFYFGMVQRGGVYDELREELARIHLNGLVKHIEFYKLENGQYPETLVVLSDSLSGDLSTTISTKDPTLREGDSDTTLFFYELVDEDNYYLRGVGRDSKPFTQDDLLPAITPTPSSNIGLLLDRQGKMTD